MIVVLRCISPFVVDAALHTTEIYRCPDSVRYEYRWIPQNPRDYALIRHHETKPRDDRMPVVEKKSTKAKKRVAKRKKRQ